MHILQFLIDHYDAIGLISTVILTVAKLTKWGKANSVALDAVIAVIEARGSKDVKDGVRDLDLKKDARKAIERKVERRKAE